MPLLLPSVVHGRFYNIRPPARELTVKPLLVSWYGTRGRLLLWGGQPTGCGGWLTASACNNNNNSEYFIFATTAGCNCGRARLIERVQLYQLSCNKK
jgi:hypothetical protein